MIRVHAIIVLLILCIPAAACECINIGKLSRKSVEQYDIIFTGKVIALSGDESEQRVQFTISEYYKGSAFNSIELKHDPSSSCALSFVPGEIWTIYGRWLEYDIENRRGVLTSDFCTFSRLQPAHDSLDVYLLDRGSFAEELKFLRDSLGVQEFLDPSEHKDNLHRNELPGAGTAIGYLVAGLGGLAIIFFFVRRMFRRDGK
jgi:hypothetical protein